MSLENIHGDIDTNQQNIDNLNANKKKGDVLQQGKDYAQSFLRNIDDFQERVRKLPKDAMSSSNSHLNDLNNFLKKNVLTDENEKNFQELSGELNTKLNIFLQTYEKEAPSSIKEESPKRNTVTASESVSTTNVVSFFGLESNYETIQTKLETSTGLSLDGMLTKYMQYIEQQLKLPEEIVLFNRGRFQETNAEEVRKDHQQMIENIKKIIAQRIQNIPQQVEEIKEQNNGEINRFMLNEILIKNFEDIATSLLSSATLYTNMHTKEFRDVLEKDEAYTNRRSFFRTHILRKMMHTREGLIKKNTSRWWEVWKGKNVQSVTIEDGEIPNGLIGDHSLHHEKQKLYDKMIQNLPLGNESINEKVKNIQAISFLNEADQKTESEAMMYFMAACVFQAIPGLGLTMSIPVDIEDALTSHEATLAYLHRSGLVPEEYQMEKTWVDNVFGLIGITGSVAGLQGLVKSKKLEKTLRKIKGFSLEKFLNNVKELGKKMGIRDEMIFQMKTMFFGKEKPIDQEKVTVPEKLKNVPKTPEAIESQEIYEEFPFLQEHREMLGELKRSDILGKGTQGIIIKREEANIVVKIGVNPEAQMKIMEEYKNHNLFARTIRKGKKEGVIPEGIRTPLTYEISKNTNPLYCSVAESSLHF